jgi:hypothetical protein
MVVTTDNSVTTLCRLMIGRMKIREAFLLQESKPALGAHTVLYEMANSNSCLGNQSCRSLQLTTVLQVAAGLKMLGIITSVPHTPSCMALN